MQVLAFTSGGDGVRSAPIHCQTEQDVPEAPSAIKALVMSGDSILVSWKPPEQPNGIVVQYTIYVREDSEDGKEQVSCQSPPHFEIKLRNQTSRRGEPTVLQCEAKGEKPIGILWNMNNKRLDPKSDNRYTIREEILPNGVLSDLSIKRTERGDSALFTCVATNAFGSDDTSINMIVQEVPEVPYGLKVLDKSGRSVQLSWAAPYDGNSPIRRYLIEYKISKVPPRWILEPTDKAFAQGSDAKVECKADGFPKPQVTWKRAAGDTPGDYKDLKPNNPNIKVEDGTLTINNIQKTNEGYYLCEAVNGIGSGLSAVILVNVQDDVVYNQSAGGNSTMDKRRPDLRDELGYIAPPNRKLPPVPGSNYNTCDRIKRGSWDVDIDRVLVPGQQTVAGVFNLRPATTYHIRIVAENEIGSSEPSDTVTIITAEEVPSGPPTNVKVEAVDQHILTVTWKAPERDDWNGEIQGYYVGYKLASSDQPFLFETVKFSKEEGKEHHLQIANLKTYTQYSVVVQAFNKVGAGPMSEEVRQYTAEGIPEQPPQDTTCTTLTSQTIRVSWVSPPLTSANGVIKGYKVVYGPSETWFGTIAPARELPDQESPLKAFLMNLNLVVPVAAAALVIIIAIIVICVLKGKSSNQKGTIAPERDSGSVRGSALFPWLPNWLDVNVIVPVGATVVQEPKSQKVPQYQMSYEATGLKKKEHYEFWVTASTNIGEGQPSKSVTLSPSSRVPAKIASFDDTFTATYKEDVKLPCLAVGNPLPEIKWKVKGVAFSPNDRTRQLPEGFLLIKEVTRSDAGEYSCFVENSFGQDTVTHQLIVHGKCFILSPPHSPQVSLTSTTTSSITMRLKPHPTDTNTPLHGYTVHYKPEFGEWETTQVAAGQEPNGGQNKYTLEGLWCGTRYQIYVTAYNNIGTGEPSDILNTRTKGSKPILPELGRFLEVSTNSVTLHLSSWSDGGCPMLYFVVENKK
ncbi:hypothetical protein J437_LFUL004125, partial [Ladona fulva]